MAFNNATEKALKEIAINLNIRGFVIDEDVQSPCRYTQFSVFITSKIRALRNRGYRGGKLKPWNTQFRPGYSSYGAVDSSLNIDDEIIFEYCNLKSNTFSSEHLTVEKLKYFRLGILFECDRCNHQRIVKPYSITNKQLLRADKLKGECTKCNNKNIQPSDLVTF